MIRGIVFDLDGTLLNTLKSIANAFNRSLLQMGFPTHDIESYRLFVGDGVYRCAERCLPAEQRTTKNINQLVEIERQDYATGWKLDAMPYEGISDLLESAEANSLKLAVLTNKDDQFAQQCVSYFFPTTPFSSIIGHSEKIPHKPDPAGGMLIANQLDLAPRELVMVGDTNIDIHTAKACNMVSVGVLWGFRERKELVDAGADKIITHPNELLGILH